MKSVQLVPGSGRLPDTLRAALQGDGMLACASAQRMLLGSSTARWFCIEAGKAKPALQLLPRMQW